MHSFRVQQDTTSCSRKLGEKRPCEPAALLISKPSKVLEEEMVQRLNISSALPSVVFVMKALRAGWQMGVDQEPFEYRAVC